MRVTRLMLAFVAAPLLACGDDQFLAPLGTVTASGTSFAPSTVTLDATHHIVTWGFLGGGTHSVAFEDAATGSGPRNGGAFSRDFTSAAPGTYRYRCEFHSSPGNFSSGMVGQVIVPVP